MESDIIKENLNTSSNKYETNKNKNFGDKTHENNETQNENINFKDLKKENEKFDENQKFDTNIKKETTNNEIENPTNVNNNKEYDKNKIIDENSKNIEKLKQNEKNNIIDTKVKGNNAKEDAISIKDKNKIDNKINKSSEKPLSSDKNNVKDDKAHKDKSDKKQNTESSDSSSDEEEYCGKYYYQYDSEVCGIKNLGNNCYLNSGLQILASCEELVSLLEKDQYDNIGKILTLFKKAMISILNRKIYNPLKFINCFCKLNSNFVKGSQCCSQNFIRTILKNINKVCVEKKYELVYENEQCHSQMEPEYEKFIKSSKAFPESKVMSIFSGMSKSHSYGKCPKCKEKIDNYSFSYFIDQNMYLDEFHYQCKFSDILNANIGNGNTLTMDCPKCKKEINIKDEKKYIKLPDILIFTLERYQGPTNKVSIIPDELLNVRAYTDKSVITDSYIYELFAINIRFGSTANFGHEICQVKRNGKWYEINDTRGYEISNISNFDCSYGLFYKKKKSQINEINYEFNNIIQINTSPSQNWFGSIWNFITSPLYSLFSKEKDDFNYFKQGLYILSECDTLINELSGINIKNCNIITITKKAILKIIEQSICDDSDFINEFLVENKDNKLKKENNLQDFIKILIYNMNEEFIKMKYNIFDEKNLKYNPTNKKEINEYNVFTDKIFPQSSILFTFSSIIKNSNIANCKCGKVFEEYSFEHIINQKISLDNFNNSNFSYILKESFSIKNKKIYCDKCKKKIKLKKQKKFIKLGEILIFTLENENVKFQPNEIIDLKNYVDDSLKDEKTTYELFAINIRLDIKDNCKHQICKIKRYGKWYEIGNMGVVKENNKQFICGLFYKLVK